MGKHFSTCGLVQALGRLASDVRGQFALITASILTPVMVFGGLAVDYHLAINSKDKVQYAMDSAVIAGARALQSSKTTTEIESDVRLYFASMIEDEAHGLSCDPVRVSFPTGTNDVRADADCWQQTALLGLIGSDEIELSVSSSATYGENKIDVAFVFDVSGSMDDDITDTETPKLSALKSAALNAITTILPDPTDPTAGDVRIAIAPYDHQINVGSYFNAMTDKTAARTWPAQTRVQTGQTCVKYRKNGTCRRWEPIYQTEGNGDYTWIDIDYDITNTCISERAGDQAHTDALPGPGNWFETGEPVWYFSASNDNKAEADDGNHEYTTGAFDEPSDTAVNGTYDSCSSSQIVPLTSNATTLNTAVNNLTTNYATNGSLGFAMGWYMISPNWVNIWPDGSDPEPYNDPEVKKVIIMMTDGAFNTWRTDETTYGDGWARMTTLCNAAKAEGIIIYTIVFDLQNTTAETTLRDCATKPTHFYTPSTDSDLDSAYDEIASSISDLRIKE